MANDNTNNTSLDTPNGQQQGNKIRGRIVSPAFDFQSPSTDVHGSQQVWYPENPDDLAAAVNILKGQPFSIRSGVQTTMRSTEEPESAIVLRLNQLNHIEIDDEQVVAEAGVTTEQLADELLKRDLVLPLDEGLLRSVASSIVGEFISPFPRTLGSLTDHVQTVELLNADGVSEHLNAENGVLTEAFNQPGTVLVNAEFKAISADKLQIRQLAFPCPEMNQLEQLTRNLFMLSSIPEPFDLSLRIGRWQYGFPLGMITIAAPSDEDLEPAINYIREASSHFIAADQLDELLQTIEGKDVIQRFMKSSQGAPAREFVASPYMSESELGTALSHFKAAMDTNPNPAEGYRGVRLQAARDNDLELISFRIPVEEERAEPQLGTLSAETFAPQPLLMPFTAEQDSEIPGFSGDVYAPGQLLYQLYRKQYASSSYPAERTSPFRILIPRTEDDIAAGIAYAHAHSKAVVARSGGHQYSGLSSGDQGTIVLAMDAFDKVEVTGHLVTVGPAVKLTKLARRLKHEGMTFPFGECPQVAIGGHAQTGGYGHLLRSFGLALDYVQNFRIVLADGTVKTVVRPSTHNPTSIDNDELFWAVLGGNAGSFGIVTEYTIACIRDEDHPSSYGYEALQTYKRGLFHTLMKTVQEWTRGIENGTFPAGKDFCMTVASPRVPLTWPIMLIEFVQINSEGTDDTELRTIIDVVDNAKEGIDHLLSIDHGRQRLSKLTDSFVRRWPETAVGGREFPEPYQKRVNCTDRALTDTFVAEFVSQIDRVANGRLGVNLIFQMFMGGGAYQNKPERKDTSIPHRDIVFGFVFDLFYEEGAEALAREFQQDMQNLVDEHFSPGNERRVFWGSFDTFDMQDEATREKYYDNDNDYQRLREIKRKFDPNNVFRTRLTVPPAEESVPEED